MIFLNLVNIIKLLSLQNVGNWMVISLTEQNSCGIQFWGLKEKLKTDNFIDTSEKRWSVADIAFCRKTPTHCNTHPPTYINIFKTVRKYS